MNFGLHFQTVGSWFYSARLVLFYLLIPVFLVMYRHMFSYTMYLFRHPLESMSHGWLIPFISLYALWVQRDKLRRASSKPSYLGLVFVVLCLIVFWFGSCGMQSRIEQVTLIGLLWSIPFAFWGREVARVLLFPVGYLVFTIPLTSFLDFFTVTLRLFSTNLTTLLVNGFGINVERVGNSLYSRVAGNEFNLSVADGCSGIESFFAILAFVTIYAWIKQKTLLQKIIMVVLSIPVSVIGNTVRLSSDCIVAHFFGQQAVGGYYHDYSGMAVGLLDVFMVVFIGKLVVELGRIIMVSNRIPNWLKQPAQVIDGDKSVSKRQTFIVPVLCVVMILIVCFVRYRRVEPAYGSTEFIADSLPASILDFTGVVPYFCHNEMCLSVSAENELKKSGQKVGQFKCLKCGEPLHLKAIGESNILPKETVILKRIYKSNDGLTYNVNVVIAGHTRQGIHRPEICLPSQGFSMEKTTTPTLKLSRDMELKIRVIDICDQNKMNSTLVYWFACEERVTSSHTKRILCDVWDRSVHNRINRWVMFSIFIPSGLESVESLDRFEKFLSEFYPQVIINEKRNSQ
ncbi:MAG: exosortase/archaeosortase family protein [Kiritimatiellae bacterium]|jgi:exosortase|nr:exosortase/archaeosortase family protein [Kiritimatiellia bacterium]